MSTIEHTEPIVHEVDLPTSGASDPGQRVTPEKEASSALLKSASISPAAANDLYQYVVYKPTSSTPRVWSGRKTNFYYSGDEGMYSAINRFLDAINWVQLISWRNDTAATQTYQYSYTTGLTITEGKEVNEGFNLGLSYQGMSIGYNASTRTFKTTETTSSQTTTITVNVPPHSLVVFYQRRYDFRDEITFICDAWGREWNIGPWGGYSPLVKKTTGTRKMPCGAVHCSALQCMSVQSVSGAVHTAVRMQCMMDDLGGMSVWSAEHMPCVTERLVPRFKCAPRAISSASVNTTD